MRETRTRNRALIAVCGVLIIAIAVVFGLRIVLANTYKVPSASMQPSLLIGDRIEIDRDAYVEFPIRKGDVIVFDSVGSFSPYVSKSVVQRWSEEALEWLGLRSDSHAMVKRVLGVGGDTVSCCTNDGRLIINGEELEEPYLANPAPPSRASLDDFSVEVPLGRVFVLGDNRHDSLDSRSLLGEPGGGMIPEDKVLGKVRNTR